MRFLIAFSELSAASSLKVRNLIILKVRNLIEILIAVLRFEEEYEKLFKLSTHIPVHPFETFVEQCSILSHFLRLEL